LTNGYGIIEVMEYLLFFVLFGTLPILVVSLAEWLGEFDNIIAKFFSRITNLIIVIASLIFVIWIFYTAFFGDYNGCVNQYYGTDCLDD
tara:strand:+ start:20 stop:286 length:267 start_codon:yes stop_codon:yes gene_type:complete